jgi:N-acetylglucosaminyldiphosphoundecaprenol N-acetyl-beta-D-mannosaminyltransferase
VRDIFREMDILTPEGIAIVWASRILGNPLTRENILSAEFLMPVLCSKAIQERWSIYFLGAESGVAADVASKLKSGYPHIDIAGCHHGHLHSDQDMEAVVNHINQSKATILLVGMGQPKQEKWISANRRRIGVNVIIGVGGYFDKVNRRVDCYPEWVYRSQLCWAYRLATEPKKLWRRYTFGILKFFVRVLRTKVVQSPRKSDSEQRDVQPGL